MIGKRQWQAIITHKRWRESKQHSRAEWTLERRMEKCKSRRIEEQSVSSV
jgi:hypothetical protein